MTKYEVVYCEGLYNSFEDYMKALMCANQLFNQAMKYGGDEYIKVIEVTRTEKDWESDVASLMNQ